MRILWVGNAPWTPGGYGTQADLFVPRLRALGHDVAVLCNFGLAGTTMQLDGVTYYSGNGLHRVNHVIETFAAEHKADLVLTLHDAWVMKPDQWENAPPMAIWAPVDHWPIPPAVLSVLDHPHVQPIAMSQFGWKLMKQAGEHRESKNPKLKQAPYVPHGIDTRLFRPQPEIRDQVRDSLDVPRDAFLVGMVAANSNDPNEPDRKSFAKSLDAFWHVARKREDVYMYCHTEAAPAGGGRNLEVIAAAIGIPPDRLRFPDPDVWQLGFGRAALAQIYQAFDVLLHPAMGEGFGIPIIEAQACGVPVIVSDHSAMSELCRAGWIVDGDRCWDPVQLAWFFDPYVPAIIGALEFAYEQARDDEIRIAAVEFAQAYDADLVTETFWKPALDAIGASLTPSGASGGLSRAERRRQARAASKHPTPGHGEARQKGVPA